MNTVTKPLMSLKDMLLITLIGLAIIFALNYESPEVKQPKVPAGNNLPACLNDAGEVPKGAPACIYLPKSDEKGFAFIVTASDNRAYYAEDDDVMGDRYDPKDKYLSKEEDDATFEKYAKQDSYSKDTTGTDVPQGDGPSPLYNSKETEWFNTYNDQYKNWHHE